MTTVLVYTLVLGVILLAYFGLTKKVPNYWIPRFRLIDIHRWNIKLSRFFLWIEIPVLLMLILFLVNGNLPFPESPSLPHMYATIILPIMYIGLIINTLFSIKENKNWCLRLGVNKTQLISALATCLLFIYFIASKLCERKQKNSYRAR